MDNIQIGRLIYEKRKELGLTQQELADRLQITNKAVSKWENGDGMPDVNLLAPLAAELGLTVDELLSGEEKAPCAENNINESYESESRLNESPSDVSAKDVVIGIIACAITVGYSISGFSQIFQYFIVHEYSQSYNLWSLLPEIALGIYNIVFWVLISAVFICKLLRIQDIHIPNAKGIAIAAFVVGLPMLFVQGLDSAVLNYGSLFFVIALLLSECHGYKIPHKIFYGLAILATVCYGVVYLVAEVNVLNISDANEKIQFYIFISRFIKSLLFYILYGVFEKCCDEYER